jgi:hypothetical protein
MSSILQSVGSNVLGLFNEEAQLARCVTFAESVHGLNVPDSAGSSDHHLQFDAPGVLEGSLPLVLFQTVADADKVSFSVRLNAAPHLVQATLEGDRSPRCWHKLAPADSLMSEHNELVFAVTDGKVTFSDVVIVYTSNQLTVRKQRTVVATQ